MDLTVDMTIEGLRVRVSGGGRRAHLRLLVPWTTRLLMQWMLHWWWANGSSTRGMFFCTRPLPPSRRLDKPQVLVSEHSVWRDRESITAVYHHLWGTLHLNSPLSLFVRCLGWSPILAKTRHVWMNKMNKMDLVYLFSVAAISQKDCTVWVSKWYFSFDKQLGYLSIKPKWLNAGRLTWSSLLLAFSGVFAFWTAIYCGWMFSYLPQE